jgi:hypothetical protein
LVKSALMEIAVGSKKMSVAEFVKKMMGYPLINTFPPLFTTTVPNIYLDENLNGNYADEQNRTRVEEKSRKGGSGDCTRLLGKETSTSPLVNSRRETVACGNGRWGSMVRYF